MTTQAGGRFGWNEVCKRPARMPRLAFVGGVVSKVKSFFLMLKEAGRDWADDHASRLGAALAYYSIFSLGPLLLISLAIASFVFGEQAVSSELFEKLRSYVGDQGAAALQTMLKSAREKEFEGMAGIIGVGTLLFAATGVVVQLKDAFNAIWEVEPEKGKGLVLFVRKYLISIAAVLGLGFLLMISLVLSTLVAATGGWLGSLIPFPEPVMLAFNIGADFAIITLVFALMFKYLPDVDLRMRDVGVGAVFTSCLFLIGKYLISFYLGRQGLESSYGAAGSVILILVWIYYSAQILFFGAEFTQVYVNRVGRAPQPEDGVRIVKQGKRKAPAAYRPSPQGL